MKAAKKFVQIKGFSMAYVDRGEGVPLVFLHGNPTSSYLWRNIVAPLEGRYRCLAPDLIGMGDSAKLPETGPDAYAYATQQAFIDGWFDAVLPDEPVVLVVHDWGSALGFDWARRHPERVRGMAYMEGLIGSTPLSLLPPPAQAFFDKIRSSEGERMVLDENLFVERMVSAESTLRPLSQVDADEYRRPFRDSGEARRPTLSWPRMLPFDDQPPEIVARIDRYRAWLTESSVPKLFINAEPGRLLVGTLRELCRTLPNQDEVTVPGLHYPQEDSPMEIVAALEAWLPKVVGAASEAAQ
ncbi:MAG: haloalkane dehalogenase [Myxococcales bacterium]